MLSTSFHTVCSLGEMRGEGREKGQFTWSHFVGTDMYSFQSDVQYMETVHLLPWYCKTYKHKLGLCLVSFYREWHVVHGVGPYVQKPHLGKRKKKNRTRFYCFRPFSALPNKQCNSEFSFSESVKFQILWITGLHRISGRFNELFFLLMSGTEYKYIFGF